MTHVNLKAAEDLAPQVDRILARLFAQLGSLFPDVEMHHIGATALRGALTKGDVDVLLRVSADGFPTVVEELRRHFIIKQPGNWTPQFASFGDDTGYELPVGVQVVVKDSNFDFFLFLRDYFKSKRDALNDYNRVKAMHAAQGQQDYWKAKDEFLSRILGARGK